MCSDRRLIDWLARDFRAAAPAARGRKIFTPLFCALFVIGPLANLPVWADDFSGGSESNVLRAPSGLPRSEGTPTPAGMVRQATHQEAEPSRFIAAGSETSIPLPAPPRDAGGETFSAGPRPLGAIISVIVSLAVVLGLFLVAAWFMRRSLPSSGRHLPTEVVEILGRTPLAGRQQMHVLRFGNKMILVCVSPTSVDTLGEITDPLEIDRLAGLCAQTQSSSATAAFKQIFSQLVRDKSPAVVSEVAGGTSLPNSRRASASAQEVADG